MNSAAQVIISLIPIVGIVMGCTIVFFYLLWNHRQKMLMIKTGIFEKKQFDYRLFSLFVGCIFFGLGIGFTLFFYLKEGLSYSLLSGLVPLSTSVGLLIFFINYKKLEQDNSK